MPAGPAHGMFSRLYFGGTDLSGFSRSMNVSLQATRPDISRMRQAAAGWRDFLAAALRNWRAQVSGVYEVDPTVATGDTDDVFFDMTQPSLVTTFLPLGDEVGRVCLISYGGLRSQYDIVASLQDAVAWQAELVSTGRAQPNARVHKIKSDITVWPHTGTSVDGLAASTAGGLGVLQVFSVSVGGSITGILKHSADNVTFAALITFVAATDADSPQAQAVATATPTTTVNRYTRFDATGSGTVSAAAQLARGVV